MALSAGDKLGPYEILAPIGAGGMGEVYRARDPRLNRNVALKVLPEDFARDPSRRQRFEKEARAVAALNHPNIVAVYDVGENFLVSELVEGQTLRQAGKLPQRQAIDLAVQIAEGLAAAHGAGITHRDLKPANIMITGPSTRDAGRAKILDFGLAKMTALRAPGSPASEASTETQDAPTQDGRIIGTVGYMSPEQVKGQPADHRSDIFCFGLVLYEMLAGKRAFTGGSSIEVMNAILKEDPPELPELIPPGLKRIVEHCLDKNPDRRFQSMRDLAFALQAPVFSGPPPASILPARARPWLWAVAGLAVALAVTTAVGWWRAGRSEPLRPMMRLSVELGPEVKLGTMLNGPLLALSPDGTLLAMIVRGADGATRLATRRLDQSQTTTLAGTEGAGSPFFSPDGQWIAFNSDRKIKKISAAGGVAVTLCEANGGIAGSWGDDGNIIAPLGWGTALSRIPSGGGPPAPVTELNHEKGEFLHGWPQVLPGSRAVLFTTEHAGQNPDETDIEVVSLNTGKRTTLHHGGFFAHYLPSGHLVWAHHNALYAAPLDLDRLALTGEPQPVIEDINATDTDTGGEFGFSQTGIFVYVSRKGELQRSIFWLDSTGRTTPLHPAPGLYSSPHFSPDGKRLAFSAGDGQGHEDIWVRDLERDTASRVTVLPGQNGWPVWTPDGGSLIFWSSNPAAPGVYWIRADGAGVAQRLTDGKISQHPWSVSPDGKRLATAQDNTGNGVEIWTAPIEGDAGRGALGVRLGRAEPFVRTPFTTIEPVFSPDGRWLAYHSGEPGKKGLWVAPFPGPGSGWLVSSRGDEPVWSRNGHELFFVDGESRTIMVAGYTARGDALVFEKPRMWSPHRALHLGSPPVPDFDVSRDGKRFAIVLNSDGTADPQPITHLIFLVNFFDELQRKVPVGK
jgi:Tol biopolymer transport system component/predicted Ser/Thr protein kinase